VTSFPVKNTPLLTILIIAPTLPNVEFLSLIGQYLQNGVAESIGGVISGEGRPVTDVVGNLSETAIK
jgi:hypothetical protein